jgi:septal ring factor EnvC (AmiA/AmiB activator)
MRAQIESKITELKGELQRADEELSKLRPRVQYLETIMYRLDGALTALQGVLDAETPAAQDTDEVRHGWVTVAS